MFCLCYRLVKGNICWNSLKTMMITKMIQNTTSELFEKSMIKKQQRMERMVY